MTTLVYRDGIMAADTLVTYGHTLMPGHCQKVHRLPDGALYGFIGHLESGELMRRWLLDRETARPIIKTEGYEGLIVSMEEGILVFEDRDWIGMKLPYVAMGSGKEHAYGALFMGASAKQAVKAGMKLDPNSGGRIKALELKGWKGERSSAEQCWSSIP